MCCHPLSSRPLTKIQCHERPRRMMLACWWCNPRAWSVKAEEGQELVLVTQSSKASPCNKYLLSSKQAKIKQTEEWCTKTQGGLDSLLEPGFLHYVVKPLQLLEDTELSPTSKCCTWCWELSPARALYVLGKPSAVESHLPSLFLKLLILRQSLVMFPTLAVSFLCSPVPTTSSSLSACLARTKSLGSTPKPEIKTMM